MSGDSWQAKYFIFMLILMSGCGEEDTKTSQLSVEPQPPVPVNYTCGTIAENETCVSLAMVDNYSNERHFF